LSAAKPSFDPVPFLAVELKLPRAGVSAVVSLLGEGNTVPFIARYRKEATGGLDETQIRAIEERRTYLVDLDKRKQTILAAIAEQGKLTPELEKRILACTTKSSLEDLYLPFKRKRRTRAAMARERGLEPLSERILAQPDGGDPAREAAAFVDPERGVPDVEAALSGARDIVAEMVAETAEIRAFARRTFFASGLLVSEPARKKVKERSKFEQYYDFSEPVRTIPSHRYLAIRRGENEEVLRAHIEVDVDAICAHIERVFRLSRRSGFAGQLAEAITDGYRRLLAPSVENEVRVELKQRSDAAAVDIFAGNLRNLLLSAPLGPKSVVGVDPGLRTGCKCAAVDSTGKFLGNTTIFLSQGRSAAERAGQDFRAFLARHRPLAVAVGNGTGGRETEAFVRELLTAEGLSEVFAVQVNESGASVYSASELARDEFPELDVTVRGAISIARRLQDPLAELVKIEPKAIGVGQYQHDVHQPMLTRKLGEVVESCVNHVGVDLNTASAALLAHVSGIGQSLAKKIVDHRHASGAFRSRAELEKVSGLGPRAFQQAAGFLRIRGGKQPLDASAVHPERYALVKKMASDLGVGVDALVGNAATADRIEIRTYVGDGVGEPTLRDIVSELAKPGRDPRAEFEPPKFREDVTEIDDLEEGMALEGVVTNVTAFGAFVDVGVHQDGLVHVSQLADRFVKDPSEVVRVGDRLKVRVLGVDLERQRISLSARSPGSERGPRDQGGRQAEDRPQRDRRDSKPRGSRPPSGKPRGSGPPSGKPQGGKFGHNPFAKLGRRDKD